MLEVPTNSWVSHPEGDDLAVCPIELNIDRHEFSCIPTRMFLTKGEIGEYGIGIGDEIFMVGRLINHAGRQKNTPTARFGNISMMPDEPLLHPTGIMQESFVVEARSWSGYSGSPVFVWIPGSDQRTNNLIMSQGWGPWLLGVDWGHIHDWERVYESNGITAVAEKLKVRANTGMAGVVPAWRLRTLLDCEQLKKQREKTEAEIPRELPSSEMDS